jgi:O-antigen/teichoic acid export membrane protein
MNTIRNTKNKIRSLATRLGRDQLWANSFYLLLSTVAMAGFGFGFWTICSRLYPAEQLGLATNLISAMGIISYMGLLGFNSTFVRFLPTSDRRNAKINTGLVLVGLVSAALASIYVLAIPRISPSLMFVNTNPLLALGFVVMVTLAALNLLTDSVFIAYRAAKYNFIVDGLIQSIVKLSLPVLLVSLSAYGIFASAGIAALVALISSLYLMTKHFQYEPQLIIDQEVLSRVRRYTSANYLGNFLNILPTLVLPIIVLNTHGAAAAGYYYLAFMVANLLYTIAYSVAQALFAEGSYDQQPLGPLVKKATLALGAIIIPASAVLIAISPWVLSIFGSRYSTYGTSILRTLALAAPAVALYMIGGVLLRVTKKVGTVIMMNTVYATSIIGLSALWAQRGLSYIALAWLIGHLVAGSVGIGALALERVQKYRG